MEMNWRGLYNGENLHKKRIGKYEGKKLRKIHCSTRTNIPSEIANSSKNLLLELKLNL